MLERERQRLRMGKETVSSTPANLEEAKMLGNKGNSWVREEFRRARMEETSQMPFPGCASAPS